MKKVYYISEGTYYSVNIEQISVVEYFSSGGLKIHFTNKAPKMVDSNSQSLMDVINKLKSSGENFVKIDRRIAVNVSNIKFLEGNTITLTVDSSMVAMVGSRRCTQELRKKLAPITLNATSKKSDKDEK